MDGRIVGSEPMLVRFDSFEGRIAKGRVQSIRSQEPFAFNSLDQLFMIMEDVLDAIEFPREMGEIRNLKDGIGGRVHMFWDERQPGCAAENVGGFCGQMTLVVHRRAHSSMQGTVNIDGEKTNFRSMLELMHMLYEYLEKVF